MLSALNNANHRACLIVRCSPSGRLAPNAVIVSVEIGVLKPVPR